MQRSRKEQHPRERDLIDTAASFLPGAVTGPTPSTRRSLVAERGEGARLIDASDNAYVDYCMGYGTLILGHAHPAVTAAVRAQLERGTNFHAATEAAVRLGEKIVRAVPCAEHVAFASSRAEAAELAMRLARAHRRRDAILKFEGAAHGSSDYGLMSNHLSCVVGDYPRSVPTSAGIPRVVEDCMLVAPFNDLETTSQLVERFHGDLAAIIVEPVQRSIEPVPGFLEGLRRLTTRHDLLLIFDETVTGFRLAPGGAQERYGVVPDLCVLGPSISGGLPLGIVAGRADVVGLVDPDRYGRGDYVVQPRTYGAPPLACAAALATLNELEATDARSRIEATGGRLIEGIRQSFAVAGVDVRVTGTGGTFAVWFTEDDVVDFHSTLLADAERGDRVCASLLSRGVITARETFFVSAAHGEDEIRSTLEAVAGAARELAADPS